MESTYSRRPDLQAVPPFLVLGLTLLLLVLSGCTSSRGGGIPYAVEDFGVPDAPSLTALEEDYRIAPLDKLSVNVFQVAELTGQYQVDLTGNIALPLIGNVRAVDLSAVELEARLREVLAQKYLKNPTVAVGILEAGGSRITLEGSVKQPGLYPVFGKTSLIQAIAMAKGLDELANPKRVAIFRQIEGQRMAAAFDLTAIRAGKEPDPQIYRGDIIVVDGSKGRRAFMDILRAMPILSVFSPVAGF